MRRWSPSRRELVGVCVAGVVAGVLAACGSSTGPRLTSATGKRAAARICAGAATQRTAWFQAAFQDGLSARALATYLGETERGTATLNAALAGLDVPPSLAATFRAIEAGNRDARGIELRASKQLRRGGGSNGGAGAAVQTSLDSEITRATQAAKLAAANAGVSQLCVVSL